MRGPKLFLSFGNTEVAGSSGIGNLRLRQLLVVVAQAEIQRRASDSARQVSWTNTS